MAPISSLRSTPGTSMSDRPAANCLMPTARRRSGTVMPRAVITETSSSIALISAPPMIIELPNLAPSASWPSITDVTSRTPLTSPSFQSVLGDCGWELWQLTQAGDTMVSATATRTTCLPSRTSLRESVAVGSATKRSHAASWKLSSFRS